MKALKAEFRVLGGEGIGRVLGFGGLRVKSSSKDGLWRNFKVPAKTFSPVVVIHLLLRRQGRPDVPYCVCVYIYIYISSFVGASKALFRLLA